MNSSSSSPVHRNPFLTSEALSAKQADDAGPTITPPVSSNHHPEPRSLPWSRLLARATAYAQSRVSRYRWRGNLGGVLPDGFDAESIAAESLATFWQDLHSGVPIDDPKKYLRRLVHRHIDRLHRRKENYLLRNEPDLAPVWLDDGESVRIIETIPDIAPLPSDHLIATEADANCEALKHRISHLLAPDRPLQQMFLCLCDDEISKPRDLAAHLNLPVTRIQPLERRLRRRLAPILRPRRPHCPGKQ